MATIAIIGAGNVGATIAYSLILSRVCSDILLVDIDQTRCEAQVLDIQDVSYDITVSVGTFQQAGQADMIIITAGARQEPNEPRTNLIDRNYFILKSTIDQMKPFRKETILVIVSNPVDILTFMAQELSGLPRNQVLGTGTFLDTSRLKGYLAGELGVARSSIHAYVLGEHGDSQFVGWSSAHVSNIPFLDYPGVDQLDLPLIAENTRKKAYRIIQGKGSTYYGIGGCTASLCNSILKNTRQIKPISHFVKKYGICLSLPAILCKSGVFKTIEQRLSVEEENKLLHSAEELKSILKRYSF
jgi:L-lactate dehydrogenase